MKQHELPFLASPSNHEDTLASLGEHQMNDSRLLKSLQEILATLKSGRSHHAKRALEALIKELQRQREAA